MIKEVNGMECILDQSDVGYYSSVATAKVLVEFLPVGGAFVGKRYRPTTKAIAKGLSSVLLC